MYGIGPTELLILVGMVAVLFGPAAALLFFAVRALRDAPEPAPAPSPVTDVSTEPDPFDVTRWSENRVRVLLTGSIMPIVLLPVLLAAFFLAPDDTAGSSRQVFLTMVCGQLLLWAAVMALTVVLVIIAVKRPISTTAKVLWIVSIIWIGFLALPFAAYYLTWKPWREAHPQLLEIE